jgi:hypothetical protein
MKTKKKLLLKRLDSQVVSLQKNLFPATICDLPEGKRWNYENKILIIKRLRAELNKKAKGPESLIMSKLQKARTH